MKMVAIIGPYFGDGSYNMIENNIRQAEELAIQLANREIPFFCAHTHTRHFEVKAHPENGEKFYRAQDMWIIRKCCEAGAVLPGFEKSSGSKSEIEVFNFLEMKLFYLKNPRDEEVLDAIEMWVKEVV